MGDTAWILAGICLVMSVIFCLFRVEKPSVLTLCLKVVASLCFVASACFATVASKRADLCVFIAIGTVPGLVGDILLDLKVMYKEDGNKYFVAGTLSFVIEHVLYFVFMVLYCNAQLSGHIWWNILASAGVALVFTGGLLLLSKPMKLNYGKMTPLVALYGFVLSFMLSFAVAIAIFESYFWIFAVGLMVFLLSDLVLSMQYFGGREEKVWVWVNHILYYIAQCAIAVSPLVTCYVFATV